MMGSWLEAYVGVPFAEHGLTRGAAHCWGLVRLVLAEQCGIDVPAYGPVSADDLASVARAMRDDAAMPPWVKVESPRQFDVALMTGRVPVGGRTRALECHCGIMVDDRRVLHVEKHTASVIVPTDHWSIRQRLRGFYRHEALA